MRRFLTARWTNLVLANFPVPDELLVAHLPAGVEFDRYDGSAYVSLVAFEFLDTRVLGVPWPGYRNFLEWNLRFYVRCGDRRGVVFVREFVPPRLVAWAAGTLYNEPYVAAPMTHAIETIDGARTIEYGVMFGGREHRMHAAGVSTPVTPDATTREHFFKEHSWGFGRTRSRRTLSYRVEHPVWQVYPEAKCDVYVDWAVLYGPEWGVMNGCAPASAVLAVGSAVSVYPSGKVV